MPSSDVWPRHARSMKTGSCVPMVASVTPAELELMYDRMMTKDKDGRYHNFHFVIASVIMRLI